MLGATLHLRKRFTALKCLSQVDRQKQQEDYIEQTEVANLSRSTKQKIEWKIDQSCNLSVPPNWL
jgi:hypothetical protein